MNLAREAEAPRLIFVTKQTVSDDEKRSDIEAVEFASAKKKRILLLDTGPKSQRTVVFKRDPVISQISRFGFVCTENQSQVIRIGPACLKRQ